MLTFHIEYSNHKANTGKAVLVTSVLFFIPGNNQIFLACCDSLIVNLGYSKHAIILSINSTKQSSPRIPTLVTVCKGYMKKNKVVLISKLLLLHDMHDIQEKKGNHKLLHQNFQFCIRENIIGVISPNLLRDYITFQTISNMVVEGTHTPFSFIPVFSSSYFKDRSMKRM